MLALNLIRKDLFIIKKQIPFFLFITILIPIFVNLQMKNKGFDYLIFFMQVLFAEYLVYSAVSEQENKYKGSLYLSSTPYTRKNLVIQKYLLVIFVFSYCLALYTVLSFIPFLQMPAFSLSNIAIALFSTSFLFSIFIPLQFYLGIEKAKYILIVFLVILPVWGGLLISKILQYFNIDLSNILNAFTLDNALFIVLSFIIYFVSLRVSINIYLKKDL